MLGMKRKTWLIATIVLVSAILIIALSAALVSGGVVARAWNADSCSALCHKLMAPYVDSYYNSRFLVRNHAAQGVVCVDCHERTVLTLVGEVGKYVTGDYKMPFWQRKLDDGVCYRCHVPMAELAKITGSLRRNPHGEQHHEDRCSTCHKMHAPQVDYCASCHDNGGQRMITFPWPPEKNTGTSHSAKPSPSLPHR